MGRYSNTLKGLLAACEDFARNAAEKTEIAKTKEYQKLRTAMAIARLALAVGGDAEGARRKPQPVEGDT